MRIGLAVLIFACMNAAGGTNGCVACGEPNPSELESQGVQAMEQGEYEHAEEMFRQLVELRPSSFVGHYNLGASLSMQEDREGATQSIAKSIELGFMDLEQLFRDPDLHALRETKFFAELIENWQGLIEARRASDLSSAESLIPRGIEQRTSETLKVELLSAHDETSTDMAHAEIEMLAGWAHKGLFPEIEAAESLTDRPWVMVVLPDRRGFASWAVSVFGASVQHSINSVGGAYEHQHRRLVAQDLGATLRHEFIHVLHWRDMNRLGQVHAPWIQEGLASLVEDYDMKGNQLVPVPSWRTNIVKRMSQRHRMPSISTLASTHMNAFTSNRPLAKYAQARTIMLYLLDQKLLSEFYQLYTIEHYEQDPSGISALEAVLGKEIGEIETDFRAWVDDLEMVPETGSDLRATLGVEIENSTGDGVIVRSLTGEARRRTGLHTGSVITAINGRPTRDLFEMIRVLGSYRAGQTVTLHARRGKHHTTTKAKLIKPGG